MQHQSRFVLLGIILLLIPVSFGCSPTKFMIKQMSPVVEKISLAVKKCPDMELAGQAMPSAILNLEGLLEASPTNKKVLLKTAEAYSGYAFGFIEADSPDRAKAMYRRSRSLAARALENRELAAAIKKGTMDEFMAALEKTEEDDLKALFWCTIPWFQDIALSLDDVSAFYQLAKAEALALKIVEMDETFYFGSAHLVLGSLYASMPASNSENTIKAKNHFNRAITISGGHFLPARLMFARYYAVQIQDQALFTKTLNNVISAQGGWPEAMNLSNAVAKSKAQDLLENAEDFF